jgi:hypothetical protein
MQTLVGGFDAVAGRAGSAEGDINPIILVLGVKLLKEEEEAVDFSEHIRGSASWKVR